jgi:PAS domain S-box-containing protein
MPTSRLLGLGAASYALLGGLLSLLGWILDEPRLTDWFALGITIKANTAILIMLAAIGALIHLFFPSARSAIRAIGAVVAGVGALTGLQHLSGWDFGIDTLLFDEPSGAPGTSAPGRMGPPAAVSLTALGSALILVTRGGRSCAAAIALALTVLAVGLLSCIGYWYGAEVMYTIPRLTGIALQTATMLVALSLALLFGAPDRQPVRMLSEDSNAGVLARRLIPLALVLPLSLGWLRVRGQEAGLYDAAFGTALRSLIEVVILISVLWACLQLLRRREEERTQSERKLHASERQLAQTLRSITDGFATFDTQWRFTFVNPESERHLRKSREELLGRVVWEVFPEVVGSEVHAAFLQAMHEGKSVEVEAQDPIDANRCFVNRIYPNPEGGVSVYFQDITARKRAEEALKEADRRKDEFLATLAHELRNPLAPVRNAARVLLSAVSAQRPERRAAEIIERQVQHMARLLEDLLDVSRIARSRLELRKEWIDLNQVLHAAIEASRPLIEAAGHELRVKLSEDALFINGDSIRLTQVFSNLLNNAAKYTDLGGRIELESKSEDGIARVSVRDNGIGISPEQRSHLFEMFAQAAPALKRAQGGLGIGLALARGIVELHEGRIELESAGEGKGSQFIVSLPRLATTLVTPPAAARPFSPTVARRVLVVDDSRDNADTLLMLVSAMGHACRAAYGGVEALKQIAGEPPEVVILDLGMPDLDGYEVCRRLRSEPSGSGLYIIAITGWGQAEDRDRTRAAGFDAHLVKPVDAHELERLLRHPPSRTGAARAAAP